MYSAAIYTHRLEASNDPYGSMSERDIFFYLITPLYLQSVHAHSVNKFSVNMTCGGGLLCAPHDIRMLPGRSVGELNAKLTTNHISNLNYFSP
jgi:hypothetical protein